uniref:Sialic acid synthase-like n=1 Tax=Sinocyclocheilus grahami TaxID=75366 RepID=A0A672LMX9_SINGR
MSAEFELCPGRKIGGSNPCFIIAEIGQNHQGDIEIAKKMIRMAKDCGADCAKFQKSEIEHRFTKHALERPYTSPHAWGPTYGAHKHHLEFSHQQYRELQQYANDIGIFFTASGMDEMAIEFLNEINVPFFKVASADTNNIPYLEKTAKKGRPMVISSGMQSMETMHCVYQTVKKHNPNFTFLQCTSAYPLPIEHVNLSLIPVRQTTFIFHWFILRYQFFTNVLCLPNFLKLNKNYIDIKTNKMTKPLTKTKMKTENIIKYNKTSKIQ